MSEYNDDSSRESDGDNDQSKGAADSDAIDELLRDPKKKGLVLAKLGLNDDPKDPVPSRKDSGKREDSSDSSNQHLTPSGKTAGAWAMPPPPFGGWWFPGPGMAPPPSGSTRRAPPGWPYAHAYGSFPPNPTDPCSSRSVGAQKRPRFLESEDNDSDDEQSDIVNLLDDAEALELVEFDPTVTPKNTWEPQKPIVAFLEKHFNRSLSDDERESIMKDFPKPDCGVLTAPKLDEQVKEHLKMKGKDPHFGSEKSLYKLQEQMLDVAGPLTCLWADLLNKEARVSAEDTLLLVQRALVLLGSASHAISQERRKIAWTRINPKLKSLATEEYEKRETNLFGPGFLEKASKRIEVDKTMEKVSTPSHKGGPPQKKARYENDKSDLRSFLSKGAPARYGGRKYQRQQPYYHQSKFQSKKYYQRPTRAVSDQSKAEKSKPSQ